MDGYFNVSSLLYLVSAQRSHLLTQWNGGWPIHLRTNMSRREIECPELDTDRHHIHHLGGRTFMAAVSPWFFTVCLASNSYH